MLTQIFEGLGFNANKCSQYWPNMVGSSKRYSGMYVQHCYNWNLLVMKSENWISRKSGIFADIEIQLYDRQEAPTYIVHKLDISKQEESREIVMVQCTAWPDRSAPESAAILLQLLEVVRVLSCQYNKKTDHQPPGPWLVHCSAGKSII